MSETAAKFKPSGQELQLVIANLQHGLQPLTRKQIQITKAHLADSYQLYASLKQLPKPITTTDLKRDTAPTVRRLRQTAKELQALDEDSFPGKGAMERTAQALKMGDKVWSVRDQAVGFLNALANSFVAERDRLLWLRKEKFLLRTAEQVLVEDLILLWCEVHGIKRHEIQPGNAKKPGPLICFLQSATDPVRKRLKFRPIPFGTLRHMAAEVKRQQARKRVRRSVQKK
jgi:hypothetical protein